MQSYWVPLAALAVLALYQQFRIYHTHRNAQNREELLQTDRSATDLIEMIITLAHKMNLRAIAEGIETVRQFEHLRDWGASSDRGTTSRSPWSPS